MRKGISVVVSALAVFGAFTASKLAASSAFAQDQNKKAKEEKEDSKSGQVIPAPVAKISPLQAMLAAEAKFGGKARMALFEFDEGHWIYGVIVLKDKKLIEVDVDPVSGKAGDFESVTPEDESKEFKDMLESMIKG
jgi:uncharacterized membrane protein YkoI